MRKILWLPILAAVCAFTTLRADLTVVQHMDCAGHSWDTTILVKASRMRLDASDSPGYSVITDLKTGETIRLIHDGKTYMKIPGPGQLTHAFIDAEFHQLPGPPKDGWTASKPAAKKATISGYPADEYTCIIPGINASAWLTKRVPDYANLLKEISAYPGQAAKHPMREGIFALDMAALPGFPVRTVYEVQPGQTVTSTVLSMSAKPIADSEFDIPAGYEQSLD
jgi:hypothetical protein